MSLKMKLTSLVIAIGLVLSMLIIGVLSAKKVDMKIGGKIVFNAEGLELTLSDGHLNNEEAYTGTDAIGEKMKGIEITTSTSKEAIANALATWNGIDLTFVKNESGEGVKANSITFSITNDSSEYDIAVDIEVTTTGINSENVKITPIGMNTIHRSDVENYEIKFELLDNELSTNITSYDITFNFTKYDENAPVILNDAGESETLHMAFKTTDDATATAKVEGMTIAGTAQLDSYSGSESSVRIPAYVQKGDNIYEVRSIKSNNYPSNSIAFANNESVKYVTFPLSITRIGGFAFYGCKSLIKMEIPIGVITIGNETFENCNSLTSIDIPEGVTTIGFSAFSGCSGLERITVDPNNANYMSEGNALLNKEGTQLITGCKNTIIPSSVQTIGNSAFSSCKSLTTINIPEGVETIGNYAFSKCDNLTSIKFPASVQAIGDHIFDSCRSLISINISDVTTIGDYAFKDCSSLTSIEIPSSVQTIGDHAFESCIGLTSINIPKNVTIGHSAFINCDSLTSIIIPEGVTLGVLAFGNCSSLYLINIKEGVQTIGDSGFSGCTSLISIEIPSSMKTIESGLFQNCSSLNSVILSEGVQTIESYAFKNCYSLTSIEIPSSITTIEHSVFTGCSGLESISVNPDNTNYMSEGNALLNKEGTELIRGCKNTIIPEGVQTIGNYAFENCNSLTSIDMPEGVTTIGFSAFSGCSGLTKIKIPSSVTTIGGTGNATFERCTNLKTIIIDSPEVAVKLNKCNIYSIENGLLQDRETIYILSSIENADNLSSLISKGFSYAGVGEGEYAGYQKYKKA